MIKILFSVFLILHGLVHLLYFGHSQRYFELQPGMVWPGNSWILGNLLNEKILSRFADLLLILVTFCFVVGAIALLLEQNWWNFTTLVSSVLSSMIFILFWNGNMKKLADQGGIGILINLTIVVIILLIDW